MTSSQPPARRLVLAAVAAVLGVLLGATTVSAATLSAVETRVGASTVTTPATLGNGTTMDAIRNEVATGLPTSGRMHITRGQESLRALDNWLAKNSDAPYYDRLVAQSLADELRSVLPR